MSLIYRPHHGRERRLISYLWRLALGLGCFADGLVILLSLGFLNGGFALAAARRLAKSRLTPTL